MGRNLKKIGIVDILVGVDTERPETRSRAGRRCVTFLVVDGTVGYEFFLKNLSFTFVVHSGDLTPSPNTIQI